MGSKAAQDCWLGGEIRRLAGFSGHLGQGGASEPADHIRGPEELPPPVVVLCVIHHPRHRDSLTCGRGYVAGHPPPEHISGGHGTYPREGDQRSDGQTGWYCPPQPNSDRGGKVDSVLREHRAPRHGNLWDGHIQVRQKCPTVGRGEGGDMRETCGGVRDCPGRGPIHHIKAGSTTAGADSADRGVAVVDLLNRQWDIVRGAGMEGLPLTALRHKST